MEPGMVRTIALWLLAAISVALLPIGRPGPAFAADKEAEPNNACSEAQDFGTVRLPFEVTGSLDTPPKTPDVDYFRMAGAPQAVVQIELKKSRLADPLLGVFDSTCTLIASNDDSDPELNAQLVVTIPADGVLILAVSSHDDDAFTGRGFSSGSYRLRVSAGRAPRPIGSIRGRAVDALSQTGLAGDVFPFAEVGLYRCSETNCDALSVVSSQRADKNGRFRFDRKSDGAPLPVGTYRIIVTASGDLVGQTDIFPVGEGEHPNVGDVPVVRCSTNCGVLPVAEQRDQ
jgi:hypothetical protein